MATTESGIKLEAHRLIEDSHENATWEDLMYQIYVHQAIESGLADAAAGRTLDMKDVRARFGLAT